jgi:hypothetical protein
VVVRGHVRNGVVVLDAGVQLAEGQEVTVLAHESVQGASHSQCSLARQTAGMIPWASDAETLERLATDPEFGLAESP